MSQAPPTELNHPFFARFDRRNRQTADKRGEREHRRRVLEGLSGRVVELGAGDGANFALYPTSMQEVIAIEPHLRAHAHHAAPEAPVAIRVVSVLADDLPLADASVDALVASLVLRGRPRAAVVANSAALD